MVVTPEVVVGMVLVVVVEVTVGVIVVLELSLIHI